ncbi:MAG TPA: hypothetical protein VEL76_36815 [Gemmataceae bacterium]|nr:hypothetical protein [Gemmataceae bacterium]
MDHEESLRQVKRLLSKLPGVEVESDTDAPEYTLIRLVVRSQKTLARLAYCPWAANVSLGVLLEPSAASQVGIYDPEDLRYFLEIPKDPDPDDPPTRLQKVGIFLVGDLRVMGLLADEEAERLRRAWGCAVK